MKTDRIIHSLITSRWRFETRLINLAMSNPAYRAELLANPRDVYTKELGSAIPEELNIEVIEEDYTSLYMVLPQLRQYLREESNPNDMSNVLDDSFGEPELDLPLLVGAYTNWLILKQNSVNPL